MRRWVRAKLHGVRVTDKSVHYHGSVSIGVDLLEASGIDAYEQVLVVNLSSGARWWTYALPADPGHFTLNGGGARLGEVGDECVVMTFENADAFGGAWVVFCGPENRITDRTSYDPRDD